MRVIRVQFMVVAAAVFALGCGVAGEDGRVQLMLKSAAWVPTSTSGLFALAGPANVAITLGITNQQPTPLSMGTSHFVLHTSDGFVFRASPSTSLYPGGCSAAASVAAGATVECTVLFSFNGHSPISQVGYELDDQASALLKISVSPCTFCGGQCTDLAIDPNNCGACGIEVEGQCKGGTPFCGAGLTACGTECVNLLTDADNCGACGRQVDGAQCVSGAPSCSLPAQLCGASCTYVTMDPLNCGRCGAQCPSSYACINGACSCAPGTSICGNGCVDMKTDRNNCGACGNACGSGQACADGYCYTPSSGGSGGGSGSSGCSVNCGQFGLSCCGSSCC
jgi:hypothetical protein